MTAGTFTIFRANLDDLRMQEKKNDRRTRPR